MPFLHNFNLISYNLGFTSEIWKSDKKPVKMCQKLLIIISNNLLQVMDTKCGHFSPKKAKKNAFSDPDFGPTDDKNAIETHF